MTQKLSIKDMQSLGLEDDIREYSKKDLSLLIPTILEGCRQRKGTGKFAHKDFYITAATIVNKETLSLEPFYFYRVSCPTPVYKQIVFKYHSASDSLEYLWTIPDKFKYYHILNNKMRYYENKETRRLCQFVVLMENGDLLKWVKKENGEKPDAALHIKSQEEH
jgi:hypothetical protein